MTVNQPHEKRRLWVSLWAGTLLVLASLLILLNLSNEGEVATAEITEEAAEEVEEAIEEIEEAVEEAVEEAEEVEVEEEAAPAHDWDSVEAYELDMLDSMVSVADINDIVGEAMQLYADFYPHSNPQDMANVLEAARTSLDTHRDHFRGRTPPATYAEANALVLEAWDLMDQAFELAMRGVLNDDVSLIERSTGLMQEATATIQRATAALP